MRLDGRQDAGILELVADRHIAALLPCDSPLAGNSSIPDPVVTRTLSAIGFPIAGGLLTGPKNRPTDDQLRSGRICSPSTTTSPEFAS